MKWNLQVTAALVAFTVFAPVPTTAASSAAREATPMPDFTVFVDLPTGFVFVKLPQGWRFVGKTQTTAAELSKANVVTELLRGAGDSGATHLLEAD